MKYCSKCGKEIVDEAVICVHCGCKTEYTTMIDDKPSTGFLFLGFLLPIVGLILYLCWKDKYPKRARSVGQGALSSVVVQFIIGFGLGFIYTI